jgi:hypothetical protein
MLQRNLRMSWDQAADKLLTLLNKWPVWVTLILIITVSWFGAPIGFAVFTAQVVIPRVEASLQSLEARHSAERMNTNQEHSKQLERVSTSFDRALEQNQQQNDKFLNTVERLATGVERIGKTAEINAEKAEKAVEKAEKAVEKAEGKASSGGPGCE